MHRVRQGASREFRKLMHQRSQLVIRNGVLYRCVIYQNRELLQLVVPLSQQPVVLRAAHDAMGHPGVERMMSLLHAREGGIFLADPPAPTPGPSPAGSDSLSPLSSHLATPPPTLGEDNEGRKAATRNPRRQAAVT